MSGALITIAFGQIDILHVFIWLVLLWELNRIRKALESKKKGVLP